MQTEADMREDDEGYRLRKKNEKRPCPPRTLPSIPRPACCLVRPLSDKKNEELDAGFSFFFLFLSPSPACTAHPLENLLAMICVKML